MSAKKYERGRRITSVDELMRQRFVIHKPTHGPGFEKIYHYGWFCSWPLRLAKRYVEAGSLYAAEPKTAKATPKRDRGDFGLVGINYNFKIKPTEWPKLEVNATALWFSDTYPTPNPDILTAGITKAIEQGYGVRSAK